MEAILQGGSKSAAIALGCASFVLFIDSYNSSNPTPAGRLDERDAKTLLRNIDIINGCKRSLVKYFANQIPCKCLDELYT